MKRWNRYPTWLQEVVDAAARRPRRLLQGTRSERVWAAEQRLRLRRVEDRRQRTGITLAAVVALCAHLGVLFPLFSGWLFHERREPASRSTADVKWVRMTAAPKVGLKTTEKIRPAVKTPPRERQPDPPPPGQVVTLPPSDDAPPERADYVAEFDHRTDRETRSRAQSRVWEQPAHAPTTERSSRVQALQSIPEPTPSRATGSGTPPPETTSAGQATSGARSTAQTAVAKPSPAQPARPRSSSTSTADERRRRLALRASDTGTLAQPEITDDARASETRAGQERTQPSAAGVAAAATASPGGRSGGDAAVLPDLAALTPSWSELQQYAGMPANDYLPEVETDAETRLNAWRWKHATFFDRLKRAISRNWRGPEVYQRFDPTRQVYGTRRLVTVLDVTIDRSGQVLALQVREGSGASFLDEEALRATRVAGPFPNPPAALFGERDRYSFSFGFIITNEVRTIDFNWKPY